MSGDAQPDFEVAVIGAGFSGIGTAIKLDEAGIRDWALLEEGDGVGGAWHWNTYPGIGVDIPSFSYQFSFEQRSDWSRVYARGAELKDYADHCVDRYGLRSRIRFGTKVVGAEFDAEGHLWTLAIAEGPPLTARYVVGATGVFSQPKPPEIPGLDDFAGTVMHTARWDHGVDLRGRRVALIGTGASAVQVIPTIAPGGRAAHRPAAHAGLVPAQARRRDRPAGAQHPRARPGRAAGGAGGEPGIRRAHLPDRRPLLRRRAARQGRRTDRAEAPAARSEGPGGAREADAALRPRLQAPDLLQRVPVHVQPPQRPAGDGADRVVHAERGAHRGRRARGRGAGPRHRLQGLREGQHAPVPGPRQGRRRPLRVVGRESLPGLRGGQRSRLPEHVHDPRALRLQRLELLQPDRAPGPPHRPLPAPRPRHRLDLGRGDGARRTAATGRRCSPAATSRSSSRAPARPPTATTSTSTATPRSARPRPPRSPGARPTSTSTTTGSRSAR